MKFIVASVVLAFALVVSGEEAPVEALSHYGYHMKVGIHELARIRRMEEQGLPSGSRIVGGSFVDISQVPYTVGLLIGIPWLSQSVCGGTLISYNRVLTAAHCHNDGQLIPTTYTAVLGSNTLLSGGIRINSFDITVHSGWNPQNIHNDLAIVFIGGVPFNNVIQPAVLPNGVNDNFEGAVATASGYGFTSNVGDINANTRVSAVNLTVISNAECAVPYGATVHDGSICTSGAGGVGFCSGDAGGPLVINQGGRNVLVGVSSFVSLAGCTAGQPSGYSRVTYYLPWINSLL